MKNKYKFKIGDIVFSKCKGKQAKVVKTNGRGTIEIDFLDGKGGHNGSSGDENVKSRWNVSEENIILIQNVEILDLIID